MNALRLGALIALLAFEPLLAQAAPVQNVSSVPRLAFRDLGLASPSARVGIAVTLAYQHADQLEQLIALQNDQNSPYYRHWLTPTQFASAFGPTPAAYARVTASLERAGFRVTQTYANRTVIDVTGSVAMAERYFSTRIDRVAQPGYGLRFTNVTQGSVPADLRGVVSSVNGLHDLAFIHTTFMPIRRGSAPKTLLHNFAGAAPGLFGPVNTLDGWVGYGPLAFQRAYDFPSSHAAADDGAGSVAGIVIDADFWNSDLAKYLGYFKVKRAESATVRVPIDGGPGAPTTADNDTVETTLDVETIASTAPGAKVYVFETPNFSTSSDSTTNVIDAFNKIVSDNKVDSVNTSFGGCEDADLSYSETLDQIAAQGAALGITFHASSGDQGAYGCVTASAQAVIGTEVPASSPHVVAIGGTTLLIDANGNYQGEEGWNSNGESSGGGISDVFLLPPWQRGVKNILTLGRNLPDISFDADPDTGTALYYNSTWNNPYNPAGGTSLASPIFGGAVAQMVQVTHGRLGLAAEKYFKLWRSTGYVKGSTTYFHDSIFGNNDYYIAEPGYDLVTGIGSVDIWNVTQALSK